MSVLRKKLFIMFVPRNKRENTHLSKQRMNGRWLVYFWSKSRNIYWVVGVSRFVTISMFFMMYDMVQNLGWNKSKVANWIKSIGNVLYVYTIHWNYILKCITIVFQIYLNLKEIAISWWLQFIFDNDTTEGIGFSKIYEMSCVLDVPVAHLYLNRIKVPSPSPEAWIEITCDSRLVYSCLIKVWMA